VLQSFCNTPFLYFINLMVFGIFRGGQAGFCLKNPAKVIQAGKSAGFGNLCHGQIGICQQPFGLLQAKLQNILLGGCAVLGKKELAEIHLADAKLPGNLTIGKAGISEGGFQICRHRGQNMIFRLLGEELVQQVIKHADRLQPVFRKEIFYAGIILQTALGILQRQDQNPVTGKTGTIEVNHREPALTVTVEGIMTTLGQQHRMILIGHVFLPVHSVGDLPVNAKGDAVKGEKYFRRAHKTGSMSPECKLQYSAFCLRENDFKTGRRLLYEIINSTTVQRSQKLDAKHNMAVLMWKEGNIDEAIEYLEEVHEEKPATNTYGTLGVLYLERAKANNKYDDIMDFMLEAYDYNESDKTIADNLGETYLCMGEYEKAKEVYETLLTAEFITPMPYYNYGLVLKSLGENEKAKQQFEKALTCRFTSVLTVTREMIEQEIEKLA